MTTYSKMTFCLYANSQTSQVSLQKGPRPIWLTKKHEFSNWRNKRMSIGSNFSLLFRQILIVIVSYGYFLEIARQNRQTMTWLLCQKKSKTLRHNFTRCEFHYRLENFSNGNYIFIQDRLRFVHSKNSMDFENKYMSIYLVRGLFWNPPPYSSHFVRLGLSMTSN